MTGSQVCSNKVPNTSPAVKFTNAKAQKLRIKEDIKVLYMKKQKTNYDLY